MDDRKRSDEAAQPSQPRPDSTGTNSRPRNDTIGQTGAGLPDDSSDQVEVDEAEADRIEKAIRSM